MAGIMVIALVMMLTFGVDGDDDSGGMSFSLLLTHG